MAQRPNGGIAASAAVQAGHLGRRAGFFEEDQPVGLLAYARLALSLPLVTCLAHVLALGLDGHQVFLNDSPAFSSTRDSDAGCPSPPSQLQASPPVAASGCSVQRRPI